MKGVTVILLFDCKYREKDNCNLIEEITGDKITVSNSICRLCQNAGDPNENNDIIVKLSKTQEKVNPVDEKNCAHMGEIIGEMDCRCAGKKEVFSCSVYKHCSKRQLTSHPKVIIDGEFKDIKIQYCRFCKDYK